MASEFFQFTTIATHRDKNSLSIDPKLPNIFTSDGSSQSDGVTNLLANSLPQASSKAKNQGKLNSPPTRQDTVKTCFGAQTTLLNETLETWQEGTSHSKEVSE